MKISSLFCLLLLSRLTCLAETYQIEGEPFLLPTNAQVVWGVAVTNLPSDLWVYQVRPQTIAMSVISNLLVVGQLEMGDLEKPNPNFQSIDKSFMRFDVKNKRGRMLYCLDIAPTLGWITYHNNSGSGQDPLELAPTESQTKQLTLNCLFQCGIDRSLIESKPRSMSFSTTERGTNTVETITSRGATYSRKIDGFAERGYGITAEFGTRNDKAQLLSFDLNWRNLVPYKPYPIANTNKILDFIKSGHATIPASPVDLSNLKPIKKLTITEFYLVYFSKPPMDKLEFEYPYAEMTVEADCGGTNTTRFYLNCPILSTDSIAP